MTEEEGGPPVVAGKLHEQMKLTTLIGVLPKEMRDENGKADLDSCLAWLDRVST
jgi:hypothetical protein